jgi:hypothetical protein
MTSEYEYQALLVRGRAKYGEKFNASNLAPQFKPYYRSGARIKVRTTFPSGQTWERTGIVGATTGWRPAFLLVHRSTNLGSSDVLSERDVVIAVQNGRNYMPVICPSCHQPVAASNPKCTKCAIAGRPGGD